MAERKSRFDWLGGRVARCKTLTRFIALAKVLRPEESVPNR